MPSPFPGMDPFLEHPAFFPDLHDRLITHLCESLQETLPAPYYAIVGSRVWIESSRRSIGSDLDVRHPGRPTDRGEAEGAALALRSRPVVIRVPLEELRETFLEIRARHEPEDRLVTAIEILSLANKTPGSHGRDLYLRKQREWLEGGCHLIEIDLLRAGQHATAVPADRLAVDAGPCDYHICVRRFDRAEEFLNYPIRLEEPLPEIAIPLLAVDEHSPLDLQAVFDQCYDAGPYRRRPPYRDGQAIPPLPPEQAAWALPLLRERGLISA
ncbi:DUF4058 family protein [soil metagenome]